MRIVVLVGLPGSGKSTYLASLGVTALSSDAMRQLLTDDETNQTVNQQVFETLRYVLRQRLTLARPLTYVDATNLTPEERQPYIEMGKFFGCAVEALFFDVSLDVCMMRNAQRHRVVPVEAMNRLAAKLERPCLSEGFSYIGVVNGL